MNHCADPDFWHGWLGQPDSSLEMLWSMFGYLLFVDPPCACRKPPCHALQ